MLGCSKCRLKVLFRLHYRSESYNFAKVHSRPPNAEFEELSFIILSQRRPLQLYPKATRARDPTCFQRRAIDRIQRPFILEHHCTACQALSLWGSSKEFGNRPKHCYAEAITSINFEASRLLYGLGFEKVWNWKVWNWKG